MDAEVVEIVEETSSTSQPSLNLTYRCKLIRLSGKKMMLISTFVWR